MKIIVEFHFFETIIEENSNFKFYSSNLIDLLKQLVIKNENFTLDLISCSMNSTEFIKETEIISKLTGAKIQYSLNQTGQSQDQNKGDGDGDWILESSNENLLGIYFNENILKWNHTLYYNPNNIIYRTPSEVLGYFNSNDVNTLTYSHHKKTYTLHKDVTLDTYDNVEFEYIHVMLNDGEVLMVEII
jgi:hypothetical protein